MKWISLISALASCGQAALRFGCGTVSIQRLDPLDGALLFWTMSYTYRISGTCTTCTFSEDFSNYWTAVMFFKHPTNGSYKRVPIIENDALPAGINGESGKFCSFGSLKADSECYRQQDFYNNGNQKITAFPKGFRMTVGDPKVTSSGKFNGQKGLKFVCLQNKSTRFPELDVFPTQPCPAGIMTVHHFPTCWDGKNVDTPNHQDHMYDTQTGAFQPAGACPASHPIRMPQLAYETLYDTSKFASMWPSGTPNPFKNSYMGKNGNLNGYGTHADYVFGWKGDSLQKAMDSNCMFQACENGRPLKSQSVAQMNACTVKSQVVEDIDGWLPELPGMGGM
ncbi:hypothetical protein KVR01_012207 [Diaporthe batatas]|uniref:uncharacterized protein n=1 Tax=Diaporthe batatas TaxID=748121 RepID=UPI001D041207|nr:uncharacterized protein KVR01_012207 [Diaporthe batatas]KAG8157935.1 hypothetical protein KVR01_012207 [Diaporthe batatas]